MPRTPLAELAAIPDGGCVLVEIRGEPVGLWRDGDAAFALADRCPHAGAPLSDGHLERGVVVCPWHGWCFRVADGGWAQNPKVRTRTYPVAVEAGTVYLLAGDPAAG